MRPPAAAPPGVEPQAAPRCAARPLAAQAQSTGRCSAAISSGKKRGRRAAAVVPAAAPRFPARSMWADRSALRRPVTSWSRAVSALGRALFNDSVDLRPESGGHFPSRLKETGRVGAEVLASHERWPQPDAAPGADPRRQPRACRAASRCRRGRRSDLGGTLSVRNQAPIVTWTKVVILTSRERASGERWACALRPAGTTSGTERARVASPPEPMTGAWSNSGSTE
jgi:hypothetical protein